MNIILLAIDVQNGFQRNEETKVNAKKIGDLVNLNLFDRIISTKFFNGPESPYFRWLHWSRLFDSSDTDLLDELKNQSDFILKKYYYNCEKESLIETLRKCNNGTIPKCVFICGTDTDCCVQINATTLFELGIHPVVLVNYCASNGGIDSHLAGLTVMRRTLGAKHLVAEEIKTKKQLNDIYTKVTE